eukprot:602196-Rhodomonas_salina.1
MCHGPSRPRLLDPRPPGWRGSEGDGVVVVLGRGAHERCCRLALGRGAALGLARAREREGHTLLLGREAQRAGGGVRGVLRGAARLDLLAASEERGQ